MPSIAYHRALQAADGRKRAAFFAQAVSLWDRTGYRCLEYSYALQLLGVDCLLAHDFSSALVYIERCLTALEKLTSW